MNNMPRLGSPAEGMATCQQWWDTATSKTYNTSKSSSRRTQYSSRKISQIGHVHNTLSKSHCRNAEATGTTSTQFTGGRRTSKSLGSRSSIVQTEIGGRRSRRWSPYLTSDNLKWSSLLLIVCLVLLDVAGTAAFQSMDAYMELRPRVVIKKDDHTVQSFHGNHSHTDHFRLLQRDGNHILIGARNIVFNVSTLNLQEDYNRRIEWKSTTAASKMCFSKGKSEADCQNYIRVLAKKTENEFIVCGTNAYEPLCRDYTFMSNGTVKYVQKNGRGLCPFDPRDNSTFIYADDELYAGTVTDFGGIYPHIYKNPLKTEIYDGNILNAPDFVHSFEYKEFVFFFMVETAVEYMNCGKRRYSRVARVCKNDRGGSMSVYKNSWTTFIKSRLNCSIPGEFPFYFDEILSTSDVVEGVYGGFSQSLVYTIFSTPANSIPGSAVCVFSMADIQAAFAGRFKEQKDINDNWMSVKDKDVPEPRPGACGDSQSLPQSTIAFTVSHSLMDQSIPTFYNRPLMVKSSFGSYRLSKLTVDPQVQLLTRGAVDVIFIATDAGVILKMINAIAPHTNERVEGVLIEEIHLFDQPTQIVNLQLAQQTTGDTKLIVITDDAVTAVPLQRCHKAITCSECVGLQDPYCAWFERPGVCGAAHSDQPGAVLQNVTSGVHYQCTSSGENNILPFKPAAPVAGPVVGARAVEGAPIYSAETLAIAVTTACVACMVIGFISGFLCSRKCRGDDYISTSYSGTPYLESKLNKCDNLVATADPNMYSSNNSSNGGKHFNNLVTNFNPKNTNGKSNTNTTTTDIKPAKCAYI